MKNMADKKNHDERLETLMNQLAESVLRLSDEEIFAEVRESGVDPQREAGRTRSVLREASKAFDSVNKRLSNLGHSINSRGWRSGQGSYHNNCLNCGSSVSFTTTTGEMRGEALDGSCSESEYRSRKAASGK